MAEQQKKRISLRAKMMLLNSGITLAALVLCGLVFVGLVWFTMEKNARHDLEFFMTQTNENLNSKTEYLEQIIYDLREKENLMLTLTGKQYGLSDEKMQELFEQTVNISSRKNYAGESYPIVEQVYLFTDQQVYETSYYAMIQVQKEVRRKKVAAGYERFSRDSRDEYSYYNIEDGEICLFYPLYDDAMEPAGTLAFTMRLETITGLMADIDNYDGSFWLLYDSGGRLIAEKNGQGRAEKVLKKNRIQNRISVEAVENQTYYMNDSALSMELSSCIGIPESQTYIALYQSMKFYLGLILVITFVAAVLFILVIYRLTKPLKELSGKLELVREGDFDTKLPAYNTKEFYEISTTFNEMTEYVNCLINQVYEKQISMKEMELKFYQTQMNPHFMFNVLNTIALQAKMDQNEDVFQMINSFSHLIQAKIYREDREKVMISQELEYVRYYLYLQKNRFGNRLSYEIAMEQEEIGECLIPKLCIQLIVENAIVHGLEPKIGKGEVCVSIYRDGGDICIDTKDDGIGFERDGEIPMPLQFKKEEKDHNQVGLNNAHKIIQLAYGEAYGIHIYSKKGKGTTVFIRIPTDKQGE